jgi:hypothetical protein
MTTKKKKSDNPSPLPMRTCACGCKIEFQPNRVDQFHLNSRHYDFAYNHGRRKEKYANENLVTKAIRKNDRILEKYFRLFKQETVTVNSVILKADGFDSRYYSGVETIGNNKFFCLYNYLFMLTREGSNTYVIIKRK